MSLSKPPVICGRCKCLFSRDIIQDHIKKCKNAKKKPKKVERPKPTGKSLKITVCPVCQHEVPSKKYPVHLQLSHNIFNQALLTATTKKDRLNALLKPDGKKRVVDIFDAGKTISGGGFGVAGKKK